MAGMPAYRMYDAAAYAPALPKQSPNIEVVPGNKRGKHQEVLSPAFVVGARIFVIACVAFAVLGFIRVGLASATVTTAIAANEVSANIELARTEAGELEVQQSYLSNQAHVKKTAGKLGMGEAGQTITLLLPEDVVATNAQGDLSLAQSLQSAS